MSIPGKHVKVRILILISLIVLSLHLTTSQKTASACWECVQLTGGLCVGCDPNQGSHKYCWAMQECCCCAVSGESCHLDD